MKENRTGSVAVYAVEVDLIMVFFLIIKSFIFGYFANIRIIFDIKGQE